MLAEDGRMNENAGRFAGMTGLECRKAIVEQLKQEGYLVKVEDYTHNVGTMATATTTPWSSRTSPISGSFQ